MKTLSLMLAVTFAFGLALSNSNPARAQQSFPFTCQIGQMNRPLNITNTGANFAFLPSNGPVAAGLQPGQCAFSDRAVRPSEPKFLCFALNVTDVNVRGASIIDSVASNGPGAPVLAAALFGPTKLMNFTVRAEGQCFEIITYGV